MLTHPTLDQLRALRLDGMAQAFASLKRKRRPAISRTPNGWHCCSIAKSATATPGAFRSDCGRLGCDTAKPPSRTLITARRGGSTKHCSSSWRRAAGSPSTAGCWSLARAAWASRGYPAPWRRRFAATATRFTTRAYRACSLISISPTATAALRGCSGCWSGSISSSSTYVERTVMWSWGRRSTPVRPLRAANST